MSVETAVKRQSDIAGVIGQFAAFSNRKINSPVEGSRAAQDAFIVARLRAKSPTEAEDVFADYASTGLTLGRHPLALLRKQLQARRCRRSLKIRPSHRGPSL